MTRLIAATGVVVSKGLHRSVLECRTRCIGEDDALRHLIDHGRQPGALQALGLIEARGLDGGSGPRRKPLDGSLVANSKLGFPTPVGQVESANGAPVSANGDAKKAGHSGVVRLEAA